MATDEGILQKSGVHDLRPSTAGSLYHPYKRDDITIFFRDRTLSDLIGFQYMHGPARESAGDLIRRLKEIPEGSHVSIALDGENPWDYYPNSGRDFLRRVFEGIQQEPALEAVTLSEADDRCKPEASELAGSGFMGQRELQYLDRSSGRSSGLGMDCSRARGADGQEGAVPEEQWDLAYEELLIAEGSDWMWWFGNDFSSDSDAIFDSLFRQHIGNIYRVDRFAAPDGLENPIKKSLGGRTSVMV